MIDTRQELLIALADAAELEHNLACLYLFAAFSLKTGDDGLPADQTAKVEDWKSAVLSVAQQEMGHLGIVCNLLTAVGGRPHFGRSNFPQPALFYPPDIPFTLEKFSQQSLARFIDFERPEAPPEAEGIAPEPLEYKRVGDLYRQIRAAVEAIPEADLFVNADAPQDESGWSANVIVSPVTNRAQALQALDDIIVQGEGTPSGAADSHYGAFLKMAQEYEEIKNVDPAFDPARPVAPNPQPRKPRDAAAGSPIVNEQTRDIAELSDVVYGVTLRILAQYYTFAGETLPQRRALRQAAVRLMRQGIRPLGELLTRLPLDSAASPTAGAAFLIYGIEDLTSRPRAAWTVILEQLEAYAAAAEKLAGAGGVAQPILNTLATQLRSIRTALATVRPA